ncbi:MAG: bifunctional demethylmenaquinone methyltransferase/2-methoxy-6-polyprenyl-1,4-benzoquinol methylase UbiE [Flavobacteriaceae bacterium]|nr:bifunctional demethylmenaquinone methyltransferase/2-methoxy-6-polyprenyl-1,4-benzoquinol methylase UbiE [Flavobacteriaceae bacterium]
MKPYKNKNSTKKGQITSMFNSISGEYDFLNKIMTFGIDEVWRTKIYKIAKESNPKIILDLATGTADIAIELANIQNAKIIGVDISKKMLDVGSKKILKKNLKSKIHLQLGDAENIDYPDKYFDVVTIGFGVRNFENLKVGLKEAFRVLKKNGKIIILETSVPKNLIIRFFYKIFVRVFVTTLGKLFSKDKSAYNYLQKSAEKFPHGSSFISILKKIGFKNSIVESQMFGATSIYTAEK